ncbi:LysM peptidoglycan-binding domain-containing protein [Palleronia caenipelagi]|uniref:LysM peptidoglycan-binding domain-containing protein n=1 Tax=Palleronia caenipelagi TaxID=2489174 RepID=A0A547PKH9_9RHOB|nr:LysM domain-containing protein [Palleronia caenipelagi]TRD14636.1 LysM peptidoglycan-binding domain-containing protein [Palleronia caenipelagi]
MKKHRPIWRWITVFLVLSLQAPFANAQSCESSIEVAPGQTMGGIAQQCGIPLDNLLAANPGVAPERLEVGQVLRVPGAVPGRSGVRQDAYSPYLGDWAPSRAQCANAASRWRLTRDAISGVGSRFAIRGIGVGSGRVLLDLIDPRTGASRPVALALGGDLLTIQGSGFAVALYRCEVAAPLPEVARPAEPAAPIPPTNPTSPSPAPATLAPEEIYTTQMKGTWQGAGGGCTGQWRLGDNDLTLNGTPYTVANISGNGGRVGINALTLEGVPATFTLWSGPNGGLRVKGGPVSGTATDVTLTRCSR